MADALYFEKIKHSCLMKLALLFFFVSQFCFSQSPYGDWYATLNAADLPLVFHIQKDGKNAKLTVDSPKQMAFDMPAEITILKRKGVQIFMKNIGVTYLGTYYSDSIVGVFKQGAISEQMVFYKEVQSAKELKRPQNPKGLISYEIEDVRFLNKLDSFYLAGSFTKPKTNGPFPAVVLVSGSGPQNRDEEVSSHRPFWVIADYLTNLGYAVLRYDDRGTFDSEGEFNGATTMDFAADAESAVSYLMGRKDVNANQIVVMGHSEGGLIANILAARLKNLSGIVSLAGTSIRGDSIITIQSALILESSAVEKEDLAISKAFNKSIYAAVIEAYNNDELEKKLDVLIKKYAKFMIKKGTLKKKVIKDLKNEIKQTVMNPWMDQFIKYAPSEDIKKIDCHILVLIGSKDIQVTSKENIEGYKKLLPKNDKIQVVKELEGLNHLFQKCTTCSISEYGMLEETFSKVALEEIGIFLESIWTR